MTSIDRQEQRRLKAIGHKLKPVLTVAGNGLTDTVLAELERALNDHELIKIKLSVGDRAVRDALIDSLVERSRAAVVQRIGNTALLLRRSKEPDPRLSNLIRRP
ncbi:MAG: YhbY family RNA-binding protein [Chromatocurvus sp.]